MRAARRSRAVLWLGLVALILALGSPRAAAATRHPFLGALTGERIAVGDQFKGACGVAVDSHGDLYVADYYGNRILVFNPLEEFLTEIDGIDPRGAGGAVPIDGPCDLAVDPAGRLYVVDYHRDVVRLTPTEFPPTAATTYSSPVTIDAGESTGVAVDPASGDVYVDDRTSVAVFDSYGRETLRIGAGSLQQGFGVAVSDFGETAGRVYVADAASETVKVYEAAAPATPIEEITGAGNPRGGFHSLFDGDLAVDPADGHVYVTDNLQPHFEAPEAVVYEFSPQGYYRGQLPSPAVEGESSFLRDGEPSAIAIAPDRDIYVSDGNYEGAAIFVFGPAPPTPTQLLSISKSGTGAGAVVSSPAGLRCGDACVGEFERGSAVTLYATPAAGSRFAGWSGCEASFTAGTCTETMEGDRALGAEFEALPPPAEPPGEEDVGGEGGGNGEAPGGPPGGQTPSRVAARTLTVATTASGSAGGTVTSAPAGISCGGVCAMAYRQGTTVTLTARSAAGSTFSGWGGCDAVSSVSCTVALGADRTVVAAFAPAAPRLRILGVRVRGATARLRVALPGPGELSAAGPPRLRTAHRVVMRGGRAILTLRLRGGARALHRAGGGHVAVRVRLAFTPFGEGAGLGAARRVVFHDRQGTARARRHEGRRQ